MYHKRISQQENLAANATQIYIRFSALMHSATNMMYHEKLEKGNTIRKAVNLKKSELSITDNWQIQ